MDRATVILLALLIAPVPLVLLVALLRGYRIILEMRRDRDQDR